jgi:hypothetical protein
MIITLCWTLFACISFISQYFFIYDFVALKKLSGSIPFWNEFAGSLGVGIFGGFAGGWLLVFNWVPVIAESLLRSGSSMQGFSLSLPIWAS